MSTKRDAIYFPKSGILDLLICCSWLSSGGAACSCSGKYWHQRGACSEKDDTQSYGTGTSVEWPFTRLLLMRLLGFLRAKSKCGLVINKQN